MKRVILFLGITAGLIFTGCKKHEAAKAAATMPGDNLDLYAVLDAFKASSSLESFEKSLNNKSKRINNIDLNGDGKVDYIKVIDNKDGDDHAITLRIPINKSESQDVAVIEIEKTGDKTASLQIIGDDEIYGKGMVIEPKDGEKAGFVFTTTAVNVYYWPVVTYVYSPDYVVYVSPYDYEYYPVWYDPWEPVAYEVYYPTVYTYHSYYYPIGHPRFERAQAIYTERRVVSGYVMHQDYRHGGYQNYGHHNGPVNYAPKVPSGGNRNIAPRGNQNYQRGNYTPHGNERRNPAGQHQQAPRGNKNNNSPMRNDRIRNEYSHPSQNGNQRTGGGYSNQKHSGGNTNSPRPQQNRGAQPRPQQPHGGNQGPRGGNHGGGHGGHGGH